MQAVTTKLNSTHKSWVRLQFVLSWRPSSSEFFIWWQAGCWECLCLCSWIYFLLVWRWFDLHASQPEQATYKTIKAEAEVTAGADAEAGVGAVAVAEAEAHSVAAVAEAVVLNSCPAYFVGGCCLCGAHHNCGCGVLLGGRMGRGRGRHSCA